MRDQAIPCPARPFLPLIFKLDLQHPVLAARSPQQGSRHPRQVRDKPTRHGAPDRRAPRNRSHKERLSGYIRGRAEEEEEASGHEEEPAGVARVPDERVRSYGDEPVVGADGHLPGEETAEGAMAPDARERADDREGVGSKSQRCYVGACCGKDDGESSGDVRGGGEVLGEQGDGFCDRG